MRKILSPDIQRRGAAAGRAESPAGAGIFSDVADIGISLVDNRKDTNTCNGEPDRDEIHAVRRRTPALS